MTDVPNFCTSLVDFSEVGEQNLEINSSYYLVVRNKKLQFSVFIIKFILL